MVSTTFRSPETSDSSKVTPEAPRPESEKPKAPAPEAAQSDSFTLYEGAYKHPYTADYFEVGKIYNEPGALFKEEVEKIEQYFAGKIRKGEMVDRAQTISEKLKAIEKHIGVDRSERPIIRLSKVAAYIDFLMKTDNIKLNQLKYGQ